MADITSRKIMSSKMIITLSFGLQAHQEVTTLRFSTSNI